MADPWAEFADAPAPSRSRARATPVDHTSGDDWSEFEDAPVPAAKAKAPVAKVSQPTGEVHDGDTFAMRNGGNARLFGVDAFELGQTGTRDGTVVPLGGNARDFLAARVGPGNVVADTGARTYGRPVVTVQAAGADVGHDMVLSGNALPTPRYLALDPARRADYIAAQREAIGDERGAYAGEYQIPEEYRHQGAAAPKHGKIAMSAQQVAEYSDLIRNPKTTPEQLEGWAKAQGHVITNASNILSFVRRNPNAKVLPYFQQDDAEGQAVLREDHGIVERNMGALNEGIADVVGFPVDLANTGMKLVGLPMSDRPVLGSEWVRDQMHGVGIGQYDEDFAPRSTAERYLQATARGVGQSLLPIGGTMAAGTRLAATAVPAALEGGVVRQAVRNATREAAANPRLLIAGETGANVGGNVAGQAADDYAPGNPYAQVGAQIVGSLAGGIGAGSIAGRGTRVASAPLQPPHWPDRIDVGGEGRVIASPFDNVRPDPVDTAKKPPVPQAPHSLTEVQPLIDQWAARKREGTADVMFHGSPRNVEFFDPYSTSQHGLFGAGTYLTEHPGIAAEYSNKGLRQAVKAGADDPTVYAVSHSVKNPMDMNAPANLEEWKKAFPGVEDYHEGGDTNENWYRAAEDMLSADGYEAWDGRDTMVEGVGSVRNLASRQTLTDRVLFSEIGARAVGLMQGAKEGLLQAARTARTGEGSDFGNKMEATGQDAISGVKGQIVRIPTRLLSAEDELFKGMARRMELSGLAVRQAASEGLRGEAGRKRVAELLAHPTEEMLDKAFDYGRYLTFQRPLGEAGRGFATGFNKLPGAKFVVPFIRTPTNLLKFAAERSPAAPLIDSWRADFRAGGARRDLAVTRAMVGTGVGLLVAEMAAKGNITGNGPADDGAKAMLRADGWQPYSIRIGDKYYSYSRMDPFSTTLGVAADMVELQEHMTEKQRDDVATLIAASVMQNLSSKTWLSGISSLVEAVNEPDRYSEAWLKRLAASAAVPAGVAQVARTMDPAAREAESILDAVKARVPGLSKSLNPKRDAWGRPVIGEGGAGPDIVSPVWQSTRKNDPVTKALLDAGININPPQREVGGVRLDGKQWGQYRERAGQIGYGRISELVDSPDWKGMTDEERKDAVSDIMRDARKEARAELDDGTQ